MVITQKSYFLSCVIILSEVRFNGVKDTANPMAFFNFSPIHCGGTAIINISII